jgi:hypothetical protein
MRMESLRAILRARRASSQSSRQLSNRSPVKRNPAAAAFGVESLEGRVLLSTDLALGRATFVSSTHPGDYAAANATDGNHATRWAGQSEAGTLSWIYVDLGSTFDINRVVLSWQSRATSFKVQTSAVGGENDADWTDVHSTSSNTQYDHDLSVSGSGRYVRIDCLANTSSTLYSLFDFEVYGPENIALGRPAVGNSTHPDAGGQTFVAANATDGNAATRWASNYDPDPRAWIYVDLGASYRVTRVKL